MRKSLIILFVLAIVEGCQTAPRQKITVGVRLSTPRSTGSRHKAAKTPLDLTIEYEISPVRPEEANIIDDE